MPTLFPQEIPSLPNLKPLEFEKVLSNFSQYPVELVQTALLYPETRNWFEERWIALKNYLDINFEKEFRSERFAARTWELRLADILDRNYDLIPKTKDEGPDFCVQLPKNKMWVEAICCEWGKTLENNPAPKIVQGEVVLHSIENHLQPPVIRINSAFDIKFKKFKNYLMNPGKFGITQKDICVIAICGAQIQGYNDPIMLLQRAVKTSSVTKKSEAGDVNIPTNLMDSEKTSIISALLYGDYTFGLLNSRIAGTPENKLFWILHSRPKNPLTIDFLKFGKTIE